MSGSRRKALLDLYQLKFGKPASKSTFRAFKRSYKRGELHERKR